MKIMKTAFVTGADQGIGEGFVKQLLKDGWMVFATSRKSVKDLPTHENLEWVSLELFEDDSIKNAFQFVSDKTDTIDLLINNAGINKDTATNNQKELVSTLQYLDRDSLLKMYNINAVAPFLVIKEFLPLLTGDPSFIMNVSSCRASFHDEFENELGNYGYRASKIALNMFTFCSLKDLPAHIKIFSVHPGNVKTGMNPDGTDDPSTQAHKMLQIVENWNDEWNGRFMRYSGEPYPL